MTYVSWQRISSTMWFNEAVVRSSTGDTRPPEPLLSVRYPINPPAPYCSSDVFWGRARPPVPRSHGAEPPSGPDRSMLCVVSRLLRYINFIECSKYYLWDVRVPHIPIRIFTITITITTRPAQSCSRHVCIKRVIIHIHIMKAPPGAIPASSPKGC